VITEYARVVTVGGGFACVEPLQRAGCTALCAGHSCSAAVLERFLFKSGSYISVKTSIPLQPGDQVILAIREIALVRGALIVYGVPLLSFLLSTGIGTMIFPHHEPRVMLVAGLGLAVGFGLAWLINHQKALDARCQPVILNRLAVNLSPDTVL